MHRILLELGPFTIYSYGAMLALAFLLGSWVSARIAVGSGLNPSKITDLAVVIIVSGLAGARALFVLINWGYYRQYPLSALKIWEGGLVLYGGIIAGLISTLLYLKAAKMPFWKTVDILSPGIALGISIGRIGCFLNGCCYGKISNAFGMPFPADNNSLVFMQQLEGGLLKPGTTCSLPVIPTQLYSSAAAFLLFLFLLAIGRKKRFDGYVFCLFIMLYSAGRFIIESFRYYEPNYIFGFLTLSQLISLSAFCAALIVLLVKSSKKAS